MLTIEWVYIIAAFLTLGKNSVDIISLLATKKPQVTKKSLIWFCEEKLVLEPNERKEWVGIFVLT